jgi:hypothetical protein
MKGEKMKKVFAGTVILLVAGMLVMPVIAEELGAQRRLVARPRIKTIGILGKGLAISQTDYKDFKIVKFGIARVITSLAGEESELSVGVLWVDDDRYKLKNIVIGNGSASGDIYLNDTKVGSFEVSSIMKGKIEVWVGTLTINEETRHVYVLEAPRPIKPREMGENLFDFCKEHPDRCKKLLKGIGAAYCEKTPEDVSCREKIKNWCQDHPKDERCLALFRNYCKFHLDDTRCREEFKEYCEEHPDEEKCKFFELKITEKYCEKHPRDKRCLKIARKRLIEYCTDHPTDPACIGLKTAKEFFERAQLARFCMANPNLEKCKDFCENHPIACSRPPVVNVTAGCPPCPQYSSPSPEWTKRCEDMGGEVVTPEPDVCGCYGPPRCSVEMGGTE